MKKYLLCIAAFPLLSLSSAFPQNLMNYVSEVKGDTLVIKDYYDMSNQPNSLYYAMLADSIDVPVGRVYELKANGYYPLSFFISTMRKMVIVGEDNTILVNIKNEASRPPIICGFPEEGESLGGIAFQYDLTVKNCNLITASPDGSIGWAFFSGNADNVRLTLQNCLLEQIKWAFMITRSQNLSWYIKDCYFVNMNDNYERRSGGVLHIFAPQDTLLVENSTHIMAQGYLYRFWSYPFKRIIFNHNTFLNCANVVFQDYGSQSDMSVTNNIFVNCNVKPYIGIGHSIDPEEEDIDQLPVGIVNVYPDMERKYLVDKNVIYWDPELDDIVDTLNSNQVNLSTNWVSQMITMNQRTQSMFNDKASNPYLTEGEWFNELPNFTETSNLFTTQIENIKSYVIAVLDTNHNGVALPDWRVNSTNIVRSDFPIPVDLSYDNTVLLNGATGGFPVGDLNWFPNKKSAWLSQRDAEYAYIQNCLDLGLPLDVKEIGGNIPADLKLAQNYPNPFNPGTRISFSIPKAGYVTLKVYDISGQEVATLLDEFKTAQEYSIRFDGFGLASGIYIYKLKVNGYELSRKMVFVK